MLHQPSIQDSPFLTKLPRELRDMIYDLVFTDDYEIKPPHPLMRVSRSLREETTAAFARNVGPRAAFYIACITHHRERRTGPMLAIQGTNNTSVPLPESRSVKAKSRSWAKNPYQPWREFRHRELDMQMVPRMHHSMLEIKMRKWMEIDITSRDDVAPKVSVKGGIPFSGVAAQAYWMCVKRVEGWQDQEATCSVEWIEAFVKDLKDGWTELRLRLRREERRALGLEWSYAHDHPCGSIQSQIMAPCFCISIGVCWRRAEQQSFW